MLPGIQWCPAISVCTSRLNHLMPTGQQSIGPLPKVEHFVPKPKYCRLLRFCEGACCPNHPGKSLTADSSAFREKLLILRHVVLMERSLHCFSYVSELTSPSVQTLPSKMERNGKRVNEKLGSCSNITSSGFRGEVAARMFILAVISVRMTVHFFFLLLKILSSLFRSIYMHLICTHRLYRKHTQVYFAFASKLHSQPFLPWPMRLPNPVLMVGSVLKLPFLPSSWIL